MTTIYFTLQITAPDEIDEQTLAQFEEDAEQFVADSLPEEWDVIIAEVRS